MAVARTAAALTRAAAPARPSAPYPVAARELLRDTLLDAALGLMLERDWAEVTMAEVAAAAGVSRQTLYSEFGSRGEFARAFVMREADRFLTDVEQAVRSRFADPVAALSGALEVFLTGAAEHPLIRSLVSGEGNESLLPLITTQGRPVVALAAERLVAVIREGWPDVAESDARLLSESVVRLAISHAALPAAPADATAASLATILGPFLEHAVGGAATVAATE